MIEPTPEAMGDVIQLRQGHGSYLATVALYRRADGSVAAVLTDMPTHVVEADATITQRFTNAAVWCVSGALDFLKQAVRFDEETREGMENDRG